MEKTMEVKKDVRTVADIPKLVQEWHPTKNEYLSPEKITAGSHRKIWWQCEKGHEWEARVGSRAAENGSNCPYCTGQRVSEDNCLATLHPEVAAEWHPTKNGELTAKDVTAHSHKTVWWQCEKGHEWKSRIVSRTGTNNKTRKGTGCPYCAGRKVSEDNCLATLHPEVAAEWHPTKNGELTAKDVTPGTNKNVWWQCKKGHEWKARLSDRTGKKETGCPYCSGQRVCEDNCLATLYPDVAAEWNKDKNGELTPKDVTAGTNLKVWWKCDKGHEWDARVSDRTGTRLSKCPYCQGRRVCEDNCLATLYPEVAADWHPTKNGELTAKDVTPGSSKKVWWKCKNGHEWETSIRVKVNAVGNGCKLCAKEKKSK